MKCFETINEMPPSFKFANQSDMVHLLKHLSKVNLLNMVLCATDLSVNTEICYIMHLKILVSIKYLLDVQEYSFARFS